VTHRPGSGITEAPWDPSWLLFDMDLIPYDQFEAATLAVDLEEPDAVSTLTSMLDTSRPFLQEMRAHHALWRRTADPDPFLSYARTRLADDEPPSTMNWAHILNLLTDLDPDDRGGRVEHGWSGTSYQSRPP
jgi:hypothetical protein